MLYSKLPSYSLTRYSRIKDVRYTDNHLKYLTVFASYIYISFQAITIDLNAPNAYPQEVHNDWNTNTFRKNFDIRRGSEYIYIGRFIKILKFYSQADIFEMNFMRFCIWFGISDIHNFNAVYREFNNKTQNKAKKILTKYILSNKIYFVNTTRKASIFYQVIFTVFFSSHNWKKIIF